MSYEKVTDEELTVLIATGVNNSSGDWINGTDLQDQRSKATLEYVGLPKGHLAPQGVSSIVDTSTTEVIEGYTAITSELFLSDGKIAKFIPDDDQPKSHQYSRDAAKIVNHVLFRQNNGWQELSTWFKSAFLWKNGIIRWDFQENFEYRIEEFEQIGKTDLDLLLGENPEAEMVTPEDELVVMTMPVEGVMGSYQEVFMNVRIRYKKDKSKIKISNVPPENFMIDSGATCIESADFVGIRADMSRSEIRKTWPEVAEDIEDWDELGGFSLSSTYNQDAATRELVTAQAHSGGNGWSKPHKKLEANQEVEVIECWLRVDRDGDGIAELKHIISVGSHILFEEDVCDVPVASICPVDIPFEFHGLSLADQTRSSTLATTAILRGFVENVYLTNYSPKLADPNIVDYGALVNAKPKDIIPTNGNPHNAVAAMAPETISSGTVPMLQNLQVLKEQSTGMSKAAQGLQDELYVSGNSEAKLTQVQNAAQKRIQHIARRFAETGVKRLIRGVYKCIKDNMDGVMRVQSSDAMLMINVAELPADMECDVNIALGENSNQNKMQKLSVIGQQILPGLNGAGAGNSIKPEAPAVIATQTIEAMGLDSNLYLQDYNTPEFKEQAEQALQEQTQKAMAQFELEQRVTQANANLSEANVEFTAGQTKNSQDDNIRQLAKMADEHHQDWAKLTIEYAKIKLQCQKDGVECPPFPKQPQVEDLVLLAKGVVLGEQGITADLQQNPEAERAQQLEQVAGQVLGEMGAAPNAMPNPEMMVNPKTMDE